ncbi:MAG: hypothetical protein M3Y65_20390, partial [Pseudomonadota bacterium]|nr:hypothetical protein [Pseudomonadota bacterium]
MKMTLEVWNGIFGRARTKVSKIIKCMGILMFKHNSFPKKYRRAVIYNFGAVSLWIAAGLFFPFVNLSENQTLYIFSSISQVVAGIYGLTLAGYVFLSNQQDRLIDKDDSLIDIVGRIQEDQHSLVMFITILSVSAMFVSLLTIGLREIENCSIMLFVSNGAVALFISAILWTAYFVADVTRPDKISEESKAMKDEISAQFQHQPLTPVADAIVESGASRPVERETASTDNSNLAEFIRTFNRIDDLLETYADINLSNSAQAIISNPLAISPNTGFFRKNNARWTISRIVKALVVEGRIDKLFANDLSEIIRYRNALVHGQ